MIIDFDITILIPFAVIWMSILLWMKFVCKKGKEYLLFFSIFYFYIMETVKYTQFPIYVFSDMEQTIFSEFQWIPIVTLNKNDIITSALNVLLTIPFGILTQFLKRDSKKRILIKSAIFSALIETMQFAIAMVVGGTFRVVDINDVIFNIIGGFVGYLFFQFGLHLFLKYTRAVDSDRA